jgi:hypothetical protein
MNVGVEFDVVVLRHCCILSMVLAMRLHVRIIQG